MGGTKGLLGLVVGLGILIVAGFGVVVATLAHRMIEGGHRPAATPPAQTIAALGEPPGTRIGTLVAAGDRLALLLQGGGSADRIVLLDPRDGTRLGTIVLTTPPSLPPVPPP